MNKEQVVSPFSDKGAILKRKKGAVAFRKEEFEITEHYYQCVETGEEFTTDDIISIGISLVCHSRIKFVESGRNMVSRQPRCQRY